MKMSKAFMILFFILFSGLSLFSISYGATKEPPGKKKILVVDSYHKEYLWSQHTHEGFCAGMLKFGYFDDKEQAAEYTKNDSVETSRAVVKRLWMDAKRKSSKEEREEMSLKIYKIAKDFNPDFIFLGDDDAAQYIGNLFLDTKIPIVFWGVNSSPVKYGLVDSEDKPGHNVTGIYQTTYYAESLEFLKKMIPGIKTFAIVSDDTTTGRIHTKAIQYLAKTGRIPLKLIDSVSTNDYRLWKEKIVELQGKVDAFFVAQFSGLKDKNDRAVSDEEAAAWYITHVKIPEAAGFRHRVINGMLCAADDSGYNQGYDAVAVAHDILAKGAKPATYPPRVPKRGPLIVNTQRAKMLGITLTENMGIEEYIEEAASLKSMPN